MQSKFMSANGKTKTNRQPVLAADMPRILAELKQLAAASARTPAIDKQVSSGGSPAMVIRGK